jgi:hypothetical protein
LQGARDVVLPDHLGEGLRTVFAGEHAVTHGRTLERGAGAIQQDLFPKNDEGVLTIFGNPC